MIDLSLHISKLLFSQNKLVIPKLGVFEVEIQEAYNHPVSNEFTPKYKKIKFSKNFDAIDDYISKSLSEKDADKLISDFVEGVKYSLETTKSYEFVNIGTLKLHDSGALIFEQVSDFNFEKSYFGLEAFVSKPIEKEKEIVVSPTNIKKDKPKAKLLWLWLSIAAVAILVVVFVIFRDTIMPKKPEIVVNEKKPIESVINENADNVVDTDTVDIDTNGVIASSDTGAVEEAIPVEEQVTVEDKAQETAVVEEVKPVKTKKYYVIAGCFKSDVKAKEYLQEIQQKGYTEASIEGKTNGGLIRVCYAGFDSYSKAKVFMKEASDKESKSLWIQKITH